MKIRPMGAEFFHGDRRMDMTKLMVIFRNFEHSPKNDKAVPIHAMKVYRGSGGLAPLILHVGIKWR